jgi:hypothetical protein
LDVESAARDVTSEHNEKAFVNERSIRWNVGVAAAALTAAALRATDPGFRRQRFQDSRF